MYRLLGVYYGFYQIDNFFGFIGGGLWRTVNFICMLRYADTCRSMKQCWLQMKRLTYEVTSEAIKEVQVRTNGKGSTREIAAAISSMPLIYEPAARWYYSLAHDILAVVVEVVSGEKFGDYLRFIHMIQG